MIKNKRILITGGAGSIGGELSLQLVKHNKVFILDNNETAVVDLVEELKLKKYNIDGRIGDIRDIQTIKEIFSDFKPHIVINASALKHVSPSQNYPREYVLTNIIGHLNLIEVAKYSKDVKKVLYISTDKAVADKKNVMGATKMCSETIHSTMGDGYIAVRFGNVMYSRGSLLEIWKKQFEKKEPLTITDIKMKRYMMTIPEACSLVIKALELGKGGEVFILNMGKLKKIIDLKNELYGEKYPIKIIGIRSGESLEEKLMTDDEIKRAKKIQQFFII